MSERFRLDLRLMRLALLAATISLFALLSPAAFAQDSSGSDGSETEGQDVAVSHSDEDGTSTSGEGGSDCSSGSEVTVVTDEGTSHPSGGSGTCQTDPTAAPETEPGVPSSASTTATTPTPVPEEVATTSPAVAQPQPIVSFQTPRPNAILSGRQGTGFPFVLIAGAIALAAAGYFVMTRFGVVLGRIAPRDSLGDAWNVPYVEDGPSVRVLPPSSDPFADPLPAPPTEPIHIDGAPGVITLGWQDNAAPLPGEAHAEADSLTTGDSTTSHG